MNGIRWMPMIRWLKFPFRVHILHKTVQLSVHELRAGSACVRLKACPTVPPSPLEAEGEKKHFWISSLCLCLSFPWPVSRFCCEVSVVFSFVEFLVSHTLGGSPFGKKEKEKKKIKKISYAIQSHYILGFLMIEGLIISFFRTKQETTTLYCENSAEIPTRHIICIPCQWCNIIPHSERVSNFSLCESESEQGSYSLPDNCQNNSR